MTGRLRILGVDPGSMIAGFACLEIRKLGSIQLGDVRLITAGVVRTEQKEPMWKRIGQLNLAMNGLMDELRPNICVVERAFFGANVATAIKLGEVRGAIISSACASGVVVEEATPAEVKKTIAGNGRATKEDVARAVETFMKFKRGALPFDATDALAIALYYGLTGKPRK